MRGAFELADVGIAVGSEIVFRMRQSLLKGPVCQLEAGSVIQPDDEIFFRHGMRSERRVRIKASPCQDLGRGAEDSGQLAPGYLRGSADGLPISMTL